MTSAFTRPVIHLLVSLLLFTVAMAVLNTLVPLWLEHDNASTLQVGIVSSGYFLGNLIGTLVAGLCIQRLGFNNSYYFACFIFVSATIALGCFQQPIIWSVWRLFAGIACSVIWVIVESALLRSGTVKTRGLLLAAYMVVYYFGTVFGQILLSVFPTLIESVLPWAATLLLLSIMPLMLSKFVKPESTQAHYSILAMFSLKPARIGIYGCVTSGVVLGVLYGLLPLLLAQRGYSDSQVANWMALLVASGIIGQFPMGKLAMKHGHLTILKLQTLLVILSCLLVVILPDMIGLGLILLGCFGFTLYPLAMAWACGQVNTDQLVAMNQTLLLSYAIGSLAGPLLASVLMEHIANSFLFITIGSAAALFLFQLFHHDKVSGNIRQTY